MKTYSHNYEKPSRVQSILRFALEALCSDNIGDATNSIMEAREILSEYLAADNMVEDNDVYPGWVKGNEADDVVFQTQQDCIDALHEVLKKLKAH